MTSTLSEILTGITPLQKVIDKGKLYERLQQTKIALTEKRAWRMSYREGISLCAQQLESEELTNAWTSFVESFDRKQMRQEIRLARAAGLQPDVIASAFIFGRELCRAEF